jgi:hypothetical protein
MYDFEFVHTTENADSEFRTIHCSDRQSAYDRSEEFNVHTEVVDIHTLREQYF